MHLFMLNLISLAASLPREKNHNAYDAAEHLKPEIRLAKMQTIR